MKINLSFKSLSLLSGLIICLATGIWLFAMQDAQDPNKISKKSRSKFISVKLKAMTN